jgi:hypothetical protein
MGLKGTEKFFIQMAALPVDTNTAGVTGSYGSFALYKRCTVVCIMADGTAASDLDMLIYQATDNAGTGAKVLNALETGRIYTMYAADLTAYEALTSMTKVTQATADEQYTPTDSGESVGLMILELQDTDLDVDNSFDHMRCDLSDPGAAKIAALIYIWHDPRYPAAPERMKTSFGN